MDFELTEEQKMFWKAIKKPPPFAKACLRQAGEVRRDFWSA